MCFVIVLHRWNCRDEIELTSMGGPDKSSFIRARSARGLAKDGPVSRAAAMERKIFDLKGHAHFVTFSCYKRRKILDDNRAKGVVIHFLADRLRKSHGECIGFVVMPDHVHAMVDFGEPSMLSQYMQQWKRRSSIRLKERSIKHLPAYSAAINPSDPVWQPRDYDFNLFSQEKINEKLEYMHNNPVKAGLAARVDEWMYSSARWYLFRKPVGIGIASSP